jgi:hypothetical protein
MGAIPAFDQALEVSVEDGEVVITGPDGLCASLTAEAARESARRLADALSSLPDGGDEIYQKPLG